MDGDTKDISKTSKCGSGRLPFTQNRFRGQSFRGRDRGGRISRGGGRGMKVNGPPLFGRGPINDGAMNGLSPMRSNTLTLLSATEMGIMQPYPDPRGYRCSDGQMGMGPPPPPTHLRGSYPPMTSFTFYRHRPPTLPLPGHPGFRGRPSHLRGRGILDPEPLCPFYPRAQIGYDKEPVSPLNPPPPNPGRGHRWLGPHGGHHF
ncbi:uncharacterized protein LOC144039259 isoform X2 [Vanacampus margaritifer]